MDVRDQVNAKRLIIIHEVINVQIHIARGKCNDLYCACGVIHNLAPVPTSIT